MKSYPQSECDQQQIAALLSGTMSTAQQTQLESHLETCEFCRSALEDSASDASQWQAAARHLNDDDHDGSPSAVVPLLKDQSNESDQSNTPHASEIHSTDSASAVIIRQIVGWLDPTDDPRMLGRIGNYEIAGVIGAGGMGVVLKGFDASLNRFVAIKLLAPHLAGNGASRQRFAREAQAAAAVVHENVIAIHSVSEFNDLPYLVMPYVRGMSLQKRIDSHGPLDVAEILRIGMQTAAGLAVAHAQGLVHRDIKPANILLTDGVSRVAITDFGLARAADDASLTHSGAIAGTPQYMSPEQASGQAVDHRSDLFSLGSMLYAMCAGRPPFRADSAYGILKRIAEETARPLQDVNANIPMWLAKIIERLHARNPSDRFQSAEDIERVLADCLAHVQQPHRFPLPANIAKQTTALSIGGRLSLKAEQFSSSKAATWVTAVACGILLASCFFIWQDRNNNGPSATTGRNGDVVAASMPAGGDEPAVAADHTIDPNTADRLPQHEPDIAIVESRINSSAESAIPAFGDSPFTSHRLQIPTQPSPDFVTNQLPDQTTQPAVPAPNEIGVLQTEVQQLDIEIESLFRQLEKLN